MDTVGEVCGCSGRVGGLSMWVQSRWAGEVRG